MHCYRIVSKQYANRLSGEGARLYGGRWNSEGNSLIYAAQTSSLAMLEILVHLNARNVGSNFMLMVIDVPDTLLEKPITLSHLPLDWDKTPHASVTRNLGDAFITSEKKVAISVPSSVNTLECNYLLNDRHPDFYQVKIIRTIAVDFDRRLLDKV